MYADYRTPEQSILSTTFVAGTWHRVVYVFMSFTYHPMLIV